MPAAPQQYLTHLRRRLLPARTEPPARLGHRPALDGVRGLAILGVLLAHAASFGGFPSVAPGGHLGVTVFFVLSGFLITTLLLEEHRRRGTIQLRHFYLRRAARLVPALLVLLPFHALVWTFDVSVTTVALAMVPMLLYLTNLMRAHHLMHMAGTTFGWSLAIEEQFYLGWPPLLKRTLERGRRLVLPVAVCLAAIAVASAIRVALADQSAWRGWLYFSTITRIDALAIGCLAALARWRLRLPSLTVAGWLCLALLGYAYARYDSDLPATFTVGLPAAALATATVVLAVSARPSGRLAALFSRPALVRLGALSYGLYLWNLLPFQAWRIFAGGHPGVVGTVTCLAAGYAAAELSYRAVEQPVIAWARARMRGERRPLWQRVALAPVLTPERLATIHAAQLRRSQTPPMALPTVGPTIR